MEYLILTIIIGVILSAEVPKLIKKNLWKEIIVFSAFLGLGGLYGIFYIAESNFLNPTKLIETIFNPPAKLIIKLLE